METTMQIYEIIKFTDFMNSKCIIHPQLYSIYSDKTQECFKVYPWNAGLESGTHSGYQDHRTSPEGNRHRQRENTDLRKQRSVRPQQCSILQINFNHYNINDAIMNNSGDIYEALSVLPKHTAILV